jgi:hypothetical protein
MIQTVGIVSTIRAGAGPGEGLRGSERGVSSPELSEGAGVEGGGRGVGAVDRGRESDATRFGNGAAPPGAREGRAARAFADGEGSQWTRATRRGFPA